MKRPARPEDAAEMPFSGHLQEFRSRLITSFFILIFFAGVSFYFSETLLVWLKRPLETELIFLSPAEAFWADLKISLFVGFLCAFPVILYEIWRFVSPGLLPHERGAFLPFLVFGIGFFFLGLAFSYFLALPFALQFLINYGRESGLTPRISVSMYIDFNLRLLLASGFIFELPLVMILLAKFGLLTPEALVKNRKYAVIGAFVIAAVVTPTPDIFNQLMMAVPLLFLYEVGIVAVRLFGGRRGLSPQKEPEGN
ncbi:MAG: twin-arginine translocase subunit TatC [Nitrospiria bacterium]